MTLSYPQSETIDDSQAQLHRDGWSVGDMAGVDGLWSTTAQQLGRLRLQVYSNSC